MNKLLLSFLFFAVFTSCSRKYKIEGTSSVSSLDGKMLFIKVMDGDVLVNIDSAEVVHGKFLMTGKVDSIEMAMLYMDEESIMPLVMEGGDITISITNTEQRVSGTPLNDKFYTFIGKKNSLELKMEEVRRKEAKMIMNGEDPVSIQEKLIKEADQLSAEMESYVKDFIIENSKNVLGPTVFIMLCNSFPHPVITPQIDEIINKASGSFKNNRFVKEYLGKARENMQMIRGNHPQPALPSGY